jgi:outer membrane receptor for ferrienterochelin and colicins
MIFSKMSSLYLIIFMLILAVSYPYAQNPPALSGTVTGQITNPEGKPLEGVIIILNSNDNSESAGTETNAEGNYILSKIPAGRYNIKAELIGFKSAEKKNVTVKSGDTITVDLILSDDSYTTEEIDVVSERFRQAQNDMRTSLLNLSPKPQELSRAWVKTCCVHCRHYPA